MLIRIEGSSLRISLIVGTLILYLLNLSKPTLSKDLFNLFSASSIAWNLISSSSLLINVDNALDGAPNCPLLEPNIVSALIFPAALDIYGFTAFFILSLTK